MDRNVRHSVRIRVRNELRRATVRRGWKKWDAEVVEESAGGFSFTVANQAPLKAGDAVTLEFFGGSHRVEILRVEEKGDRLQVGVRRCGEEVPPPKISACRSLLDPKEQGAPHPVTQILLFLLYVAAAVAAAVFLVSQFGS
jgi:hypothetical protein